MGSGANGCTGAVVLDRSEERRSVLALLSEALNLDGDSGSGRRGEGGGRVGEESREVMLGERGRGDEGRRKRRVTQVGSWSSFPLLLSSPVLAFPLAVCRLSIVPLPAVWPTVL